MSVINSNINALNTQGALVSNNRALATAMQQLSTGKRINSAKDDAVGMAISTRITQQVQALDQSVRNAGDAISLIQTTEGATNEITSMLQRMRELSIQSINDSNANEQRGYLDLEFQQLKQQIVQIANATEWNGFPILNGTVGQQVGPVPVVRATSAGQFMAGVTNTAGAVTSSNAGTVTTTGTPLKSGNLSVKVDPSNVALATAVLTLDDGSSLSFTGAVNALTITFTNTALTGGTGTFVLTSTTAGGGTATNWATSETAAVSIARTFGSLNTIAAGDVTINAQVIPLSLNASDTLSPSLNAAGSAIAKAAAINTRSATSLVKAVVGQTVMTGSAMSLSALTGSTLPSGSVTINGYNTSIFSGQRSDTQASRALAVQEINKISSKTGVVAIDTGSIAGGITLTAADGRNIELAFNTSSLAADFASATGLKQGAQSGTYSLSASVGTKLLVGSDTGAIARSGLQAGSFDDNISVVGTLDRTSVNPSSSTATALRQGDLLINGIAIPGSEALKHPITGNAIAYHDNSSGLAIAAAINSKSSLTGVTAAARPATITGTTITVSTAPVTSFAPSNGAPVVALMVNNTQVLVPMHTNQDARAAAIVAAINAQVEGVTAKNNGGGTGISLATDGRNLSVWFSAATNLAATDFGLAAGDVVSSASSAAAITHFGGVSMYSSIPPAPLPLPPSIAGSPTPAPAPTGKIQVSTGANGVSSASNFSALGFVSGTYGGASGIDTSAPRVGRMTFQIGSTAGQVMTIDFADFGSNGPITGTITKDAGSANPTVNISTAAGATAVLASLDAAMNNINGARANMGAVMNRLVHVINNLTNVVTNSKQSRSQIEDADYALASTDLARAQIIQQAATAVLAQANTSQQSVLKLLQG